MTRPSCSTYSFSLSMRSTKGFLLDPSAASGASVVPLPLAQPPPGAGRSTEWDEENEGEREGEEVLDGTGGGRGGVYDRDGPAG